jgi:hypothetical protein
MVGYQKHDDFVEEGQTILKLVGIWLSVTCDYKHSDCVDDKWKNGEHGMCLQTN